MEIFKGISKAKARALQRLQKFISTQFIKDITNQISGYVGHQHLYALHKQRTDVFIYPSVRTDKKSLNYAIAPNVVDSLLQLKYVVIARIKHLDKSKGIAKVSISEYGAMRDNVIYWKEIDPSDEQYRQIAASLFQDSEMKLVKN